MSFELPFRQKHTTKSDNTQCTVTISTPQMSHHGQFKSSGNRNMSHGAGDGSAAPSPMSVIFAHMVFGRDSGWVDERVRSLVV